MKRRLATLCADLAVRLFDLSEWLDPVAPKVATVHVPRPRPSIIAPVGRSVAFDSAYRFVRGGDA